MRGSHIKLGEGERKVRLGQDSLPNKAEMSGDSICCFFQLPFECSVCVFQENSHHVKKMGRCL